MKIEEYKGIEFPVGDGVLNNPLYKRFIKLNNIIQGDGYDSTIYFDEDDQPYKEASHRFLLKLIKTLSNNNLGMIQLDRIRYITCKIRGKEDNYISKVLSNAIYMFMRKVLGIISSGEDTHLYARQKLYESYKAVSKKYGEEKAKKPTELDLLVKAYIKVIIEKSKWPQQQDIIEIVPNLTTYGLTRKTKDNPKFYFYLIKEIEKRENNPSIKSETKLILSKIKTKTNNLLARALRRNQSKSENRNSNKK